MTRYRLKHLVSSPIRSGVGLAGAEDDPTLPRYLRITDIADDGHLRSDVFASQPPEVIGHADVRLNDILIASVGATVGKSYLHTASGDFCYAGYLTRIRPDVSLIDPRFLNYWTGSHQYWDQVYSNRIVSTIENLSAGRIADFSLVLPNTESQRQIADYLDHETAEIDAFIADLAMTRALTQERLVSEWARLFEEAMTAPLTQIRHTVTSLVDGPFGSGLTSAHYADDGAPVVRLGNIGRNRFELQPRVYISQDYAAELKAHAVRPGDVVIAGLGDVNHPLGRAAVVPLEFGEGIVKADCYRARVNQRVSAEFLAWSLSAPQTSDSFREMSRGSTRARLNLAVVAAANIPVPERDAQDRLVVSYEVANATAESALQEIDAAIELAKERRAALITAAVTGQIDVTTRKTPAVDNIQTAIEEAR